jgi:hypothetical protein
MTKLFDAEGKEVEAFTAEELESKKKEALDEYVKNNPNQGDDLKKAQDALVDAQKKLKDFEDAGGSDEQKKRLKQGKEDAEKALGEIRTELGKQISDLKSSIFGGRKTKMLDALAKGDVETRKKIELEYDAFRGDPSNEVEMEQRLVKAATIVTGNKPQQNFMDGMSNGNNKGVGDNGGVNVVETEASKAQRKDFGISDKDAEKYGAKKV